MDGKILIMIAAHKEYPLPQSGCFLPVWAGSANSSSDLSYQRDDEGENISSLNPGFCELTVLYWGWKNLPGSEFIGLEHYRRRFGKKGDDISLPELEKGIREGVRLFVPKKRRYYIESLRSHYCHTHSEEHLKVMDQVVSGKYPEMKKSYDRALKKTYGYMFNMMIARRDVLDEYCNWLFDILFEIREKTDVTGLSSYDARLYGRLSELLFNVWLDHKISLGELKASEVRELSWFNTEKTDWIHKGTTFLKAKFFGRKYEKSF
ncbi:MAG: DUF4422 domain-containing protein [Clostridiales bacterium]|nr:DUF4422 domain-containing protein [Clostridiales bacterium]